ncbi:B-cell receptor CD22-like isoform X3 [Channa argus]
MVCSFYHPHYLRVNRVMWGHVKLHRLKGRLIFDSRSRKNPTRFQYVGDKNHSCSLKIDPVMQNDAGIYIITFNNYKIHTWGGNIAPTLKVVDLEVLVTKTNRHETMKEGNSVTLTCINKCDSSGLTSAFAWFKNGEAINEGPVLYFNSISSTNSGNYTCSLKTQARVTSRVLNINVEYGPKNTSVFVSSVTDVGNNITLVCSSQSNPPVENYTWFKVDDENIVEVGHEPVFLPGDGDQYLCSVSNKHGSQNSSVVTLKNKGYWATFSRDVVGASAAIAVILIVTTVIAVSRVNKNRKWARQTDSEKDAKKTDYINWVVCDRDPSHQKTQCEGETAELTYATIYFTNESRPNM